MQIQGNELHRPELPVENLIHNENSKVHEHNTTENHVEFG